MNSYKVMSDAPIDALRRTLMLGVAGAPLVQLAGCGGGSSGSGSAAPPLVSSPTPGADLPIIPLVDGSVDETGTRNFSLVAQAGTTFFRSGVATATLGYNGQLLGPALRLRSGEKVALHVQNNLGEDTTVHWHGLLVPAEEDWGPSSGHRNGYPVDRQFHSRQSRVDLLVSPAHARLDRPPGCHGPRRSADRR